MRTELALAIDACDRRGYAHRSARLVQRLSAYLLPGARPPAVAFEALPDQDVGTFVPDPTPTIVFDPRSVAGIGRWPAPCTTAELLEAQLLVTVHELCHYDAHLKGDANLDPHGWAYRRAVDRFAKRLGMPLPAPDCGQWPMDLYARDDGTARMVMDRLNQPRQSETHR